MNKKKVVVGYVNDEFGEFWIYRDFDGQMNLPKKATDKFTGKNVVPPKEQIIMGTFIINRKKYTLVKEHKVK